MQRRYHAPRKLSQHETVNAAAHPIEVMLARDTE